ncbi:MAG TPA: hypothetical protein VIX12_01250 [Candidatus Binataceae bacterium]
MATETALQFLGSIGAGRRLAPVILISGPHAFLRENVLDCAARALVAEGCQYRAFHIGAGDDFSVVLNELRAPDLFAPKRVLACRVLKARREKASDGASDEEAPPGHAGAAGSETALASAIEQGQGPGHLIVLYERDSAPAKIRKAAEQSGLSIICGRPYENQVPQYVQVFARELGVKLSAAAVDHLIGRHAGDLGAIFNALAKAALAVDSGRTVAPEALDEAGTKRMPAVFEIADSIARGRITTALAQIDRSIALGRDAIEILALEVIPLMRRMMIAASMLARRRGVAEIASALGLAPQSSLASNAIDGARRFGTERLERAYRRASVLDAGFKNGEIKEREQALCGLLMDLMEPPASRT